MGFTGVYIILLILPKQSLTYIVGTRKKRLIEAKIGKKYSCGKNKKNITVYQLKKSILGVMTANTCIILHRYICIILKMFDGTFSFLHCLNLPAIKLLLAFS